MTKKNNKVWIFYVYSWKMKYPSGMECEQYNVNAILQKVLIFSLKIGNNLNSTNV